MTHPRPLIERLLIAIDIGGTTIKGVLLDSDGRVRARHTVGTFSKGSALASLQSAIESLRPPDLETTPVASINICTPGLVRASTGIVTYAANLDWKDLPLASVLSARYALPVHIDHDARAAATAERVALDATPGADHLLFIPIGTGVSSAIIANGHALEGGTGSAGEIGHISVYPDGELCQCGQRGCVEAYASATTILARYHRAGGTLSSVADIISATTSDLLARTTWNEAIDALARGIASATVTVDPLMIIIGGGLSNAGNKIIDPLREQISRLLTWRSVPQVRVSLLGSHAGLIGAALLDPDFVKGQHSDFSRTLLNDLRSATQERLTAGR